MIKKIVTEFLNKEVISRKREIESMLSHGNAFLTALKDNFSCDNGGGTQVYPSWWTRVNSFKEEPREYVWCVFVLEAAVYGTNVAVNAMGAVMKWQYSEYLKNKWRKF